MAAYLWALVNARIKLCYKIALIVAERQRARRKASLLAAYTFLISFSSGLPSKNACKLPIVTSAMPARASRVKNA